MEKAHLHLMLLGLEAMDHLLSPPLTSASYMAPFSARGTRRCPPGPGSDFPATALHDGGSVNLPGLARCVCCGPERAVCLDIQGSVRTPRGWRELGVMGVGVRNQGRMAHTGHCGVFSLLLEVLSRRGP